MEVGEVVEELQKVESAFGSSTQVFVQVGDDAVELYGIDIRMIDDNRYEVILKGRL